MPIPTRLLHESVAKSTQFRQEDTQNLPSERGQNPAGPRLRPGTGRLRKIDVVLLQEPWTEAKNARCLTKTHPAYNTYSPVDSWDSNDTRPRVMTYIHKDSRILTDQKRPALTRDILWLTVNGVTIVKQYSCDPSAFIKSYSIPESLPVEMISKRMDATLTSTHLSCHCRNAIMDAFRVAVDTE